MAKLKVKGASSLAKQFANRRFLGKFNSHTVRQQFVNGGGDAP